MTVYRMSWAHGDWSCGVLGYYSIREKDGAVVATNKRPGYSYTINEIQVL